MFGWFKKLGRFFKKFVVVIFGKAAAKALAEAAKKMFQNAFGSVVLAIVAELSASNLSNGEKRRAAYDRIKAEAEARGVEMKDSLINLVIEMAVLRLKDLSE
ncbi:hypothetical protein LCGC14_2807720 [marine sediment metagenome]|uniref:Uncharacterized protein n=1 Tax=marine sediment metagenome TaxID=412755 RepID=A0A0F9AUA1_9ZZZZ